MALEICSVDALRSAIQSGESEIIVLDPALVTQLKAIKYIKSLGPAAIAAVVTAVPLIASTGGLGAAGIAVVAPNAAWATSAIVVLVIAVGGAIAISLLTDWEYVELPMGIKLRRKRPTGEQA